MFYILILGSFVVFLGVKCEVQIQLNFSKAKHEQMGSRKKIFFKVTHYVELHISPYEMKQKQCLEGNS